MRIRLETKILLYFLAMMAVVVALLLLNRSTQDNFLEGVERLNSLYQRNVLVQRLNGDIVTLRYYLANYYRARREGDVVELQDVQQRIREDIEFFRVAPGDSREAELHNALEQEFLSLQNDFTGEIVPRIDALAEQEALITANFDRLISQLETLQAESSAGSTIADLGPLFSIVASLRRETVEFFAAPEVQFGDTVAQYHQRIDREVQQLLPRYPQLEGWHEQVHQLNDTLSQAARAMQSYLGFSETRMQSSIERMVQLSGEIQQHYSQLVFDAQQRVEGQLNRQEYQFLILGVFAAFLAIFLSWRISRHVGKPIHDLIEVFQQLAAGKRVTKVPMLERKDDFGKLARAAEIFRHKNEDTQYLLHQSQSLVRELQDLNSELNEQIEVRERIEANLAHRQSELERSNRDLSQFAYAASHDLQEPLRMVSSYLQLLERRYKNQLDDDANEFIGYAVDGAARMKNLIRSLLDYSRIGTHGSEFNEVDLNEVIENVCKNLEVLVKENQAQITWDELPIVWGDSAQLATLLQNIVTNSIRYRSDEAPRIHIAAHSSKKGYELSIIDNGIGFDQEFSEKIFTIFQRLHSRDKYPDGTGIGLAICKRIVERHGGEIRAESSPGKGTTVYFSLPAGGQGEKHE